jgi:hypothetical protein
MSQQSKRPALSAAELLRREFGSSNNFVSPRRVSVGKLGPCAAFELSTGEGWFNNPADLFGVSVVIYDRSADR